MALIILASVWLLWPIVAFAGGLGFAPLAGLAALPLIPGAIKRFKPRFYMLALLMFFAFAGASAAWSPARFDLESAGFFKIALLVGAVGILLSAAVSLAPSRRRRLTAFAKWALLGQVATVLVLSVFERQALSIFSPLMPSSGEGVQNISRNGIIMAVAASTLVAALYGERWKSVGVVLAIFVLLAEGFVLVLRDVEAGPLALGLAAIFFLIVRGSPRHGFRIIGVGLALLILAAPFVFDWLTHGADATQATTSAGQRLAIWAKAIEVIRAHPFFGGGVSVLREMRQLVGSGMFAEQLVIPNHPHNMALQLWAEMGAAGAILLSAAIVLAAWRLPAPKDLGPGGAALAGLVGGVTAVAFVSFDLWNQGWWGACGLLGMMCVALARTPVAGASSEINTRADADRLSHQNNFNFLRLVFAFGVAIFHIVVLSDAPSLARFQPAAAIAAEVGVQGFFVVSGYLVYASLQHSASLGVYAEKRVRRVYPAYAVVILVSAAFALVASPLARASLGEVARYVGANLAFLNFLKPDLPGLFAGNPFTVVNGALWTLKLEVLFYLILPLLAWMISVAGKYRVAFLAFLYVGSEAWRQWFASMPPGNPLHELEHQLPGRLSFFVVGMGSWLLRDRIVWRWWLVAAAAVILCASFLSPWLQPLRALGLGVVVVWLAVGVPQILEPARFGDLSYGIYIIHFPVIQAVAAAGLFTLSLGQGVGVAILCTVALALLLWHLVERPALRRDSAYRRKPEEIPDTGNSPELV